MAEQPAASAPSSVYLPLVAARAPTSAAAPSGGTADVLSLSTRTITYNYDGLNRLTSAAEAPGITYAYSYDLAGNRTGVWQNGTQTQSRSYDAANRVIGWSYDAAGNLLSDGTSTSTYDALDRLTSQGGTSYTYTGDGVLVAQTVGSTTTRYTQDFAAPLSQVLNDGSANYVYGDGSERLRALNGLWYITDALGSVRQTVNNAGTPLATVSYDPWGTPQGSAIAPFGFTRGARSSLSGEGRHLHAAPTLQCGGMLPFRNQHWCQPR